MLELFELELNVKAHIKVPFSSCTNQRAKPLRCWHDHHNAG